MRLTPLQRALRLAWAGLALSLPAAWAQPAPGTAAPTPAASPQASAPVADEGYVDRVLDDGPPSQAAADEAPPETGWPRSLSIEAQSTTQRGDYRADSRSLLLSGYLDTPSYGSLSANLNLTRDGTAVTGYGIYGVDGMPQTLVPYRYVTGSTWRLDQRGVPFDGGWIGNAAMGNINMSATPLSRGVGQVYLPSLPIEGLAVGMEQPGRTLFNASAGRVGFFDGVSFQGFTTGGGTAATAGVQTSLVDGAPGTGIGRTDAALQVLQTRDVNLNGVGGFALDTRSVWGAVAWQGLAPWASALEGGYGGVGERVGGMRVQANVAQSSGAPSDALSLAPRDSAAGGWVDATWRTQLLQNSASVYYFEPSLRWGSDALPNDLRGASWRTDVATRQWQLGTNLEVSDSVSGITGTSVYANLFGRWRFDSRDAISGNVAARSGAYAAQSAQVTLEHRSDLGFTQWRTDAAHAIGSQVVRSGLDHTWTINESQTLSTSLALENERDDLAGSVQRVYWGVLGSTPLPSGARLDLNLRGSNAIGGDSGSRFLSANARVQWPLGYGWSFIAQYSAAQGRERLSPSVVSALTAATELPTLVNSANRSLLLALRWEARAGVAQAPIGGAPGAGAGRLEGQVYFDQDRNGRREASEGGVGNATVVLDGRYVTQTDAQGHYSFAAVAAGPHSVALAQDSLPLPWSSPGSSGAQTLEIFVRDRAQVDFGVQKER